MRTVLRRNSLLTGKNTGKFANSAAQYQLSPAITLGSTWLSASLAQVKNQIEQGIFRSLSGNQIPCYRFCPFKPVPLVISSYRVLGLLFLA